MPDIYSIGHSNHPIEHFTTLLREHGIACLIDVRSAPYSRYSPHFNKQALNAHLQSEGIDYHHAGDRLGGRPDDPGCYDEAGEVDYQRIENKDWYQAGIRGLLEIATEKRTAILCSEENPEKCHRNLLIARTLLQRDLARVHHIRGDGSLEEARRQPVQTRMF